jgi:hypothetical protein
MSKKLNAFTAVIADQISNCITDADYAQLARDTERGEIGQSNKGIPYWCIRAVYFAAGYARQAQYALANLESRMNQEQTIIGQIEDRATVNGTDPVSEDYTYLDRRDRLASMQEEAAFHRALFRTCCDSVMDLTDFALESLLEPVKLEPSKAAAKAESITEKRQSAAEKGRELAMQRRKAG